MSKRKEVLDHGYVSLVESWGSDERIIEAARMSTGKGFLGWGPMQDGDGPRNNHTETACVSCDGSGRVAMFKPGDEKLLRFLYENRHATPFEMAGMTIEVQAPIFVFREWHRHRTQSYNEMSARYTPLPDVNYIPSVERLMKNAGTLLRESRAEHQTTKDLNRELIHENMRLRADFAALQKENDELTRKYSAQNEQLDGATFERTQLINTLEKVALMLDTDGK